MDERVLATLEEMKNKRPELAVLLDFQREVVAAQLAVKSGLTDPPAVDRAEVARRLASGTPAVTFDELNLDWQVFERLLDHMAEIARRYRPDWPEVAVPHPLRDVVQAWYQGRLLSHALEDSEGETKEYSPADEALSFLIASAVWPFLAHVTEILGPGIDQALWRRGFCPVCGGKPDFACLDRESGGRHLFCSRCDMQWQFQRLECPFCGTQDPAHLAYYPSEDGVYRLYVCDHCHHYVKTIDLRETGRQLFLPVERILSLGMDVAAAEAGYCPE